MRTRNGRVVYGGDGIEPDIQVKGFEITPGRAELIDRLFFSLRRVGADTHRDNFLIDFCKQERSVRCTEELPFLRTQFAQFNSYRSRGDVLTQTAVLKEDPQVEAALKFLKTAKP
jgi:hypothetical protein